MMTPPGRLAVALTVIVLIDVLAGTLTIESWFSALTMPSLVISVTIACYLFRVRPIVRARAGRIPSARLALVAPLLPFPESLRWLAEMDNLIVEFRTAGHPSFVQHAFARSCGLTLLSWRSVVARWRAAVRARAARYIAVLIQPRLAGVVTILRTEQPPWPRTAQRTASTSRRWRLLHRWASLLMLAMGEQECPDIVAEARLLRSATRRLLSLTRANPIPLHDRPITAHEAALLLNVNHTSAILADELAAFLAT